MTEFVFHTNRASAVFNAALAPLGGRPWCSADSHIDLLYFDRFGGKTPPAQVTTGFQLIDRQRTIPLDNKLKMAALLSAAGIHYPRVYFDAADVPEEAETLWFIKNPMLTAGKGIQVVRREQIDAHFQPGCIIQEAIKDLLLINGRKFTLRAYVMVHAGQVYLFQDAIAVLHGAAYDPRSQDPLVQFEHVGYMDADSPISMQPFKDFAQHGPVMQNLAQEMQRTFAAFRNHLKFEKAHTFCLFGIDVLVQESLGVVLIEINDRPNLVHRRLVNELVNIPMVRALYCVLDPPLQAQLAPTAAVFEKIATL